MAYDLELAKRIKAKIAGLPSLEEKKMFGGVGFLVNGNTLAPGASAGVACGVNKDNLIVRVDPEKQGVLLKKSHAKPFDITGRPMKGWLIVEPEGCKTDKQLNAWVKEGVDFALTLPKKK